MVSIATVLKESSHKLEEVSGNNSKREAKILLEFSIKSQGKLFQLDHEISEDSYVFFKISLSSCISNFSLKSKNISDLSSAISH